MVEQNSQFRAAALQVGAVFLDHNAIIDKAISVIDAWAQNSTYLVTHPNTYPSVYPWHTWHTWLYSVVLKLQFATQNFFCNLLENGTRQAERPLHVAKDDTNVVALGHSERDRQKLSGCFSEQVKIGGLSCSEQLQPLAKYAMFRQNEQVHVATWSSFLIFTGGIYQFGLKINVGANLLSVIEYCSARIHILDEQSIRNVLPLEQEELCCMEIGFAKSPLDLEGLCSRPNATTLVLNNIRAMR